MTGKRGGLHHDGGAVLKNGSYSFGAHL